MAEGCGRAGRAGIVRDRRAGSDLSGEPFTAIDGHPATLSWIGGVAGHRTVALGVEHFGQTGTVGDLYRHYGIDAAGIAQAVSHK